MGKGRLCIEVEENEDGTYEDAEYLYDGNGYKLKKSFNADGTVDNVTKARRNPEVFRISMGRNKRRCRV
jgi:hypothetical protein